MLVTSYEHPVSQMNEFRVIVSMLNCMTGLDSGEKIDGCKTHEVAPSTVLQDFLARRGAHLIAKSIRYVKALMIPLHLSRKQEGLHRQKNQLNAYVAWHRRQGLAPTLPEMMALPSANERWTQDGNMGALSGAPKVTVILNLFKREVRDGSIRCDTVDGCEANASAQGGK